MCVQPAIDKDDTRVRSRRPAEINSAARVSSGQTTTMKDKTRVHFIACAIVHGNITHAFAVNSAVLKHSGGRAENEIDVAFDVAVFEEVTAADHKQSVLPTKEAAVFKRRTVRINKQSNSL